MFWLVFLVVAVAAQNDDSILDKIAYVVDGPGQRSVLPTLTEETVIRLSTQDFNATQVLNTDNQSATEALAVLTMVDPDDNVRSNNVTENIRFLPTNTHRQKRVENNPTIKNLVFFPKVAMKNISPIATTVRPVEEDTISYDSSTMIIPVEKTTEPESHSIVTTPSLPDQLEAQKMEETATQPMANMIKKSSETSTISYKTGSIELTTTNQPSENTVASTTIITTETPTTTYQPCETTEASTISTTTSKPITTYQPSETTTEKQRTIYKTLTPTTPTGTKQIPQPKVQSTTSRSKPSDLVTAFDSTKPVDIPASVDVVDPTTSNVLDVVTSAKPNVEVEKVSTTTYGSIPVVSKPTPLYTQSFFVSNGHGFTRYPYLQTDDQRSSIIFDMMSRFRMPQIYINTKPYIIKVPQAKIVET